MGFLLYFAIAFPIIVSILRWNIRKAWGSVDKNNEISVRGKTVIVTGASAGVGKATTLEFAKRDAHVILACRNLKKAKETVDWVRTQTQSGKLTCMEMDLASLQSVKQFAKEFSSKFDKVDILVNNAGVVCDPRSKERTVDGFEPHMGVNHIGHFLLTNLLLEPLKKAAPSRVVIVSSETHSWDGPIDFNDPLSSKREISTGPIANPLYSKSKLANALFNLELSKRLQGTGVTTYALCPGIVMSDLGSNLEFPWTLVQYVKPVMGLFFKSIEDGAQTTMYCALNKNLTNESGKMYRNCGYWPPSERITLTDDDAHRFWEETAKAIKSYM